MLVKMLRDFILSELVLTCTIFQATLHAETAHKVVIDPQYGGQVIGPVSPTMTPGKAITLSIARKIGDKITERTGYAVVYTRTSDNPVTLQERVSIANQSGGDVFISIGLNGSKNTNARGLEIFVLEIEKRQLKHFDKGAELRTIIEDLESGSLKKHREAAELAAIARAELIKETGLKDRGTKSLPFYVLVGPQTPSIMIMLGFLSNPEEAKLLEESAFQNKVAEALVRALLRYYERSNVIEGTRK